MKKVTLILAVSAMLALSACNSNQNENNQSSVKQKTDEKAVTDNSQSLTGDYVCTKHWNSDLVGNAIISFNGDSVSFAGIAKTTYRIKDDSVFIDMHRYEMGFAIDGNTLKASGNAGEVAYTKK